MITRSMLACALAGLCGMTVFWCPANAQLVRSHSSAALTTGAPQSLPGQFTEFGDGISAHASLYRITLGPDGNLWFTEYAGNRIGRITPSGVVTEFSDGISAGAGPDGIAP